MLAVKYSSPNFLSRISIVSAKNLGSAGAAANGNNGATGMKRAGATGLGDRTTLTWDLAGASEDLFGLPSTLTWLVSGSSGVVRNSEWRGRLCMCRRRQRQIGKQGTSVESISRDRGGRQRGN